MASDFVPPPQRSSQPDESESNLQTPTGANLEATVNGGQEPPTSAMQQDGLVKGGDVTVNEDHISAVAADELVKGGEITANEDHIPSTEQDDLVRGGDVTINEDHIPPTNASGLAQGGDVTVSEDDIPLTNAPGLVPGGDITINEDHIPPTSIDVSVADPTPASAHPVEQVNSGIAPVADFIPKGAANMSHPTPPPDEPLATGAADLDVDMANADLESDEPIETPTEPHTSFPHPEQSLVRPREDDGEDEPAAKRSRVEDTPLPAADRPDGALVDQIVDADVSMDNAPPADSIPQQPAEVVVEPVIEASSARSVEPVVAQATETVVAPAQDPITEPSSITQPVPQQAVEPSAPPAESDLKIETATPMTQPLDAPAESMTSLEAVAPTPDTPMVETPSELVARAAVPAPAVTPAEPQKYSTAPMTSLQKASLLEKTKNLKKTKNSLAFLRPVDYIALNIPTYPDIIKQPMDLTTLENKLKDNTYASVQAFADDFSLIVGNARRFNGPNHPVTVAGEAMEAYFNRVMESVPGPDQRAAVKAEKRSPSIATEKPRREPRAATLPAPPPAAAPAAAPAEPFALQPDGTPTIRRQSSMSNRPARAIKPPQNREIAYSKPKRKEHQLELRFCEHILDELRSPKYGNTNQVFLWPVDPVALNIPNYRQVVKQPMDLSTMSQKLKGGQYATAAEFRKDFDLMIKNCLIFNPMGNPVHDLGIQFQRQFEELWKDKEKWERKNQPASNRASSASGDEESGVDDDEEDDDDAEDDKSATIRALQKQLAEMQNALSGLNGEKPAKSKKAKASKSAGKKQIGSTSSIPSKKAAPKAAKISKRAKVVTYEEKQEISEAVGRMDDKQVARLTEIITENCEKYRNMDEMELEIDDLPNNVQVMLLDYVRRIFGNPNKKKAREPSPDDAAALDDDDYEERGGARGGKRKKHRPMGKKEQQEAITSLRSKLVEFSQAATSGSESPTNSSFNAANPQADTSGDEESEESEEE